MTSNNVDIPLLDNNEENSTNIIQSDSNSANITEIAVQTDSNWIENLKKELMSSLQNDTGGIYKSSRNQKSRAGTSRSELSEISSKSKKLVDSMLTEDFDKKSITSIESVESLPVYPESKISDEFGLGIDSSSDEYSDDQKIDLEKSTVQSTKPSSASNRLSKEKDFLRTKEKGRFSDSSLPETLRVSKELKAIEIQPALSADAFLASVMIPTDGDICEFCKKSIIAIPSLHEQVDSNVDQAKLFCCQEFRDLVDYALSQRQELMDSQKKSEGTVLIDVSPHQSHKSPEELAEDRAKSEKKIREKLLERQNAALVAAQSTRSKREGHPRSQTEIQTARSGLADSQATVMKRPSSSTMMARQVKVINYQLSSYKFLEDGWTVKPPALSNEETLAKQEVNDCTISMDYSNLVQDVFGQICLSSRCSSLGVIRQYYPDGQIFMILFPTGSSSIYYPSGNLAISVIRESTDGPMICVIQDDSYPSDDKVQILGVMNTNGFGSFSYQSGQIRIVYNTLNGTELLIDGSRKRQWFWDGKPHVHAPPFQPLFISLNRYIGIRISSQNGIFVNFFSITRQIHINVGFRSEITERLQKKMSSMLKLETDRYMRPLTEVKNKIHSLIDKCYGALGHPNLLTENRWPIKPYTLTKIATNNKTVLSLSLE